MTTDCEGSVMRPRAISADPYDERRQIPSDGRTLSDRALELVNGPRQDSYAPPEINLGRIGAMWAAILGLPDAVPAWKVALMLSALKLARAAHRPDDDSLVDAVGYLEIVERLRP